MHEESRALSKYLSFNKGNLSQTSNLLYLSCKLPVSRLESEFWVVLICCLSHICFFISLYQKSAPASDLITDVCSSLVKFFSFHIQLITTFGLIYMLWKVESCKNPTRWDLHLPLCYVLASNSLPREVCVNIPLKTTDPILSLICSMCGGKKRRSGGGQHCINPTRWVLHLPLNYVLAPSPFA